jgi:hypothetical protein
MIENRGHSWKREKGDEGLVLINSLSHYMKYKLEKVKMEVFN